MGRTKDANGEDLLPVVLLIDDHPTTRAVLEALLEIAGFEVVTASDGRAGLQRFAEEEPDLVVTDLVMPYLGGCDVARRIRAGDRNPNVPIVAATANRRGFDPDELDRLFYDVVDKPVRPDTFLKTVRSAMEAAPHSSPDPTP